MKLFKRLAAAAMAAVMSMVLLTGCSGGGGGSTAGIISTYTMKWTVVEMDDVPYTDTYTEYITSNGNWMYMEIVQETSQGTRKDANLSSREGDTYIVVGNKALKVSSGHPWQSDDTATSTTGTWTYKGKTYQTVETTVVVEGYKSTEKYCYDGAKLEYIVTESMVNGKASKTVARVDEWRSEADETKLNLDNYTIVNSEEELYS